MSITYISYTSESMLDLLNRSPQATETQMSTGQLFAFGCCIVGLGVLSHVFGPYEYKKSVLSVESLIEEIKQKKTALKEARDRVADLEKQLSSQSNSQVIAALNEEISLLNVIISRLEEELSNARAENRKSPDQPAKINVPGANEMVLPKRLPKSVASMARSIIRK